jgi:hypothetical protein
MGGFTAYAFAVIAGTWRLQFHSDQMQPRPDINNAMECVINGRVRMYYTLHDSQVYRSFSASLEIVKRIRPLQSPNELRGLSQSRVAD